jgi:hypothetical protein
MTSIPSSYLDAVRALAPQIAEQAEESERARRLSRPLVGALVEAGLFPTLDSAIAWRRGG